MGAGCGFELFGLFGAMQPTTPLQNVPTLDGKPSSLLDFEQRVMLWTGSTDIPVEERATLLILHMATMCLHSGGDKFVSTLARQVCRHSGGEALMAGDDVMTAIQALRDYSQPDAIGRIFKQVGKFLT